MLSQEESQSRSVLSDSLWPHGLYSPMEFSRPEILEWVAFPFSRGSSQPRDQTQVSHIAGVFFTSWARKVDSKKIWEVHYKSLFMIGLYKNFWNKFHL